MREIFYVSEEMIRDREVAIIAGFCREAPPSNLVFLKDRKEGDGLQSWIGMHLKPEYEFASSISVIEAAESVARSALELGEERWWGDVSDDDCGY